jgi:predicted metal-dependent hydrolase
VASAKSVAIRGLDNNNKINNLILAKKKEQYYLEIQDKKIPIQLFRERRRSVRFAIGKKSVLVRLPLHLRQQQEQVQLQRLRTWLDQLLTKQDGMLEHLAGKTYQDGDVLEVGARKYKLKIVWEDRKTMAGQLKNGRLQVKLPKDADELSVSRNMKRLLSRTIARDFLPEISERVQKLNDQHFGFRYSNVKLRYNTSNWGSCHMNGTITLSTRLLFAPPEVIDYVIIHELAHLEVFGHSREFWDLVKKAMPSYKEKEKWLKENYYQCDF